MYGPLSTACVFHCIDTSFIFSFKGRGGGGGGVMQRYNSEMLILKKFNRNC